MISSYQGNPGLRLSPVVDLPYLPKWNSRNIIFFSHGVWQINMQEQNSNCFFNQQWTNTVQRKLDSVIEKILDLFISFGIIYYKDDWLAWKEASCTVNWFHWIHRYFRLSFSTAVFHCMCSSWKLSDLKTWIQKQGIVCHKLDSILCISLKASLQSKMKIIKFRLFQWSTSSVLRKGFLPLW